MGRQAHPRTAPDSADPPDRGRNGGEAEQRHGDERGQAQQRGAPRARRVDQHQVDPGRGDQTHPEVRDPAGRRRVPTGMARPVEVRRGVDHVVVERGGGEGVSALEVQDVVLGHAGAAQCAVGWQVCPGLGCDQHPDDVLGAVLGPGEPRPPGPGRGCVIEKADDLGHEQSNGDVQREGQIDLSALPDDRNPHQIRQR
jgi:hypothetical protein